MTMLNGILSRRGRPSIKTLVLHTKPRHWYYNSATNQTIYIHNTDGGVDKKYKKKRKRCKCTTGVNCAVTVLWVIFETSQGL